MAQYFDEEKWQDAFQYHNWYDRICDDYISLIKKGKSSTTQIKNEIKEELYQFLEQNLLENKIKLGDTGPNWDKERKPIDTIVIHHTENLPGITWQRLNAMHLLRIYATYYHHPTYENDLSIKGTPIYSHHYCEEKQVFYSYHWLIRMDGSIERLLQDNEIGWHAGKWDVNCRSIAICLDNNFKEQIPSNQVVQAIASIIKTYYPHINSNNILGHREINPKSSCPGDLFLSNWKQKIIELL
jgi:hypothetical protein